MFGKVAYKIAIPQFVRLGLLLANSARFSSQISQLTSACKRATLRGTELNSRENRVLSSHLLCCSLCSPLPPFPPGGKWALSPLSPCLPTTALCRLVLPKVFSGLTFYAAVLVVMRAQPPTLYSIVGTGYAYKRLNS